LNNISLTQDNVKAITDISDLIQSGEHSFLEFKSTLRWDIKENKINKKMEEIILKSISAFSNGEGGKLLIGVKDNMEILGLDYDYDTLKNGDKDNFELHLINLLNNSFGKGFVPLNIKVNFPKIGDLEICNIDILKGSKPIYLDITDKTGQKQKKFYVRSGNSSQELGINEVASYIKSRFE